MKQKTATEMLIEFCDKRIKETPKLKNNYYKRLKKLLIGSN